MVASRCTVNDELEVLVQAAGFDAVDAQVISAGGLNDGRCQVGHEDHGRVRMRLGCEQHAGDDASTRARLGDGFQFVGKDEFRGGVADDLGEVHQRLLKRACGLGAAGLREDLQVLDAADAARYEAELREAANIPLPEDDDDL